MRLRQARKIMLKRFLLDYDYWQVEIAHRRIRRSFVKYGKDGVRRYKWPLLKRHERMMQSPRMKSRHRWTESRGWWK